MENAKKCVALPAGCQAMLYTNNAKLICVAALTMLSAPLFVGCGGRRSLRPESGTGFIVKG